MNKDYEVKREKWLKDNGFNENLETYVYFLDNSYEVKETLKDDGFRFNKVLYWHTPELKEEYSDKTFKVTLDEIAEISAWGTGYYKENAKDYIEKKMFDARGEKEGEWLGDPALDVNKKITVVATLVDIVEVNTLPTFSEYEVYKVTEFKELVDLHKNLNLPIMYYNVTSHVKCHLYVKNNSELYLLTIKAVDLENKK